MTDKTDNGHHHLMDQIGDFTNSRAESDYLAGVADMAGGAEQPDDSGESPGRRIRQIREDKGLSLADVAKRTGLAEQMLREIESEEANPPLGVLVKLGKALDMKLGTLISGGEDRPYTVVRVAERQGMSRYPHTRETSYGYSYQALAPKKKNRSMEPFMVTLRSTGEEVAPSSHDGEEFIYVIDGSMEALVGDAMEILGPGDCIYYDSNQPHLVRPHGTGPTTILAVIYTQER